MLGAVLDEVWCCVAEGRCCPANQRRPTPPKFATRTESTAQELPIHRSAGIPRPHDSSLNSGRAGYAVNPLRIACSSTKGAADMPSLFVRSDDMPKIGELMFWR